MTSELIVRINGSNNYNLNAEGKDKISFNLTEDKFTGVGAERKIVDGKLVLKTTNGKTITLSNWENLATIKTTDNPGFELTLTEVRPAITNPITSRRYEGTGVADVITAASLEQIVTPIYGKKRKVVGYNYSQEGATINAGAGDDVITGSKYSDVMTGGSGTNRYLVDVTKDFGTDTINLTEGETVEIQLKGDNSASLNNIIYSWNEEKDLILYIYRNNLPVDALTGERQTEGQVLSGTLILKNYFDKNVNLKAFDNNDAELNEDGIGEIKISDVVKRELQAYYNERAEYAGGHTYYGSRYDDTIDAHDADRERYIEYRKVKKKKVPYEVVTDRGVTIDAGAGNDTITGSNYDDTLYGGADDGITGDIITGGAGNDYISGGTGKNTLVFSGEFGNDTVQLTETENLVLDLSAYGDITAGNINNRLKYTVSGNDLIITVRVEDGTLVEKGTIRLLGFAKEDVTTSVKVKLAVGEPIAITAASVTPETDTGYSTAGSRFNENVINAIDGGHDETVTYVKKKKKWIPVVNPAEGVTIIGGDKNDTITGSKYSDVISGGKGTNTVNVKTHENFGNDVYTVTSGETLNLQLDGIAAVDKEIVGNDLILTVKEASQTKYAIVRVANPSGEERPYDVSYDFVSKTTITGAPCYFADQTTGFANSTFRICNFVLNYDARDNMNEHDSIYLAVQLNSNNDIVDVQYLDHKFDDDLALDAYLASLDYSKIGTVYGNTQVDYSNAQIRGTITIQNFVTTEAGSAVIKYADATPDFDLKTLVSGRNIIYGENDTSTAVGTFNADTINAENGGWGEHYVPVKVKKKWKQQYVAAQGVTIDAGAGADDITGSAYDDTIIGGTGTNYIYLTVDKTFGRDTVILSETENLILKYKGTPEDSVTYDKKIVGHDLELTINDGETVRGTVVIKDFAVLDLSKYGDISLQNQGGTEVLNIKTFAYETSYTYAQGQTGDYVGTNYNDTIDARLAGQVMASRVVGKGKKARTVWDVPTGKGLTIDGGKGNDYIEATRYDDVIYGGEGNDTIFGGPGGNDIIYGGDGDDTLSGGYWGNDILYGGNGNDNLWGTSGDDILYGEAGDDYLEGDDGNDELHGGLGTNILDFRPNGGTDTVYSDGGTDKLYFAEVTNLNQLVLTSNGSDLIIKHSGDGFVILKNYFTDIEKYNNYLIRLQDKSEHSLATFITAYNEGVHNRTDYDMVLNNVREFATMDSGTIEGTNGNDEIITSSGQDIVNLGAGDDIVYASAGDDTIGAGAGKKTIVYNLLNYGTDTINLTNGEKLTLDLRGLKLTGVTYSYDGDDLVINTSKSNIDGKIILKGFASANAVGGEGYVKLRLDNGDPIDLNTTNLNKFVVDRTFTGSRLNEVIDASEVTELVNVRTTGKGKKKKTVYDYTGKGATITTVGGTNTVTGSNFGDTITLGGTTDVVNSGDGADTIYGGTGVGTINGGNGNDTIYGGEGNYVINGDAGDDTIYASTGPNNIDGGAGNDTIHGGTGSGTIYGGAGDDTIYGEEGNYSQLHGGAGNDTIYASSAYNTNIYTGTGNNTVYGGNGRYGTYHLEGENNTVYMGERGSRGKNIEMGAGNDTIYMSNGETDASNGDQYNITSDTNQNGGHDLFRWSGGYASGQHEMMCFDGTMYDDIILTRNAGSDDLIIRYGENNDVTYKDYFKEGNENFGNSLVMNTKDRRTWPTFAQVIEEKGVQTLIDGVTGTDGDDYIVGTDADEIITSGAGSDVIKSGAGDDNINLGEGNDVLYAGAGTKTIDVGSGNNKIYLGNGNSTVTLGTGQDQIHTGSGANTINFVTGDTGNDTYYFSAKENEATDTLSFAADSTYSLAVDARDAENIILSRNYGEGATVTIKNYTDTTRKTGVWVYGASNDSSVRLFDLSTIAGIGTATTNQTITTGGNSDTVYLGKGSDTLNVGGGTDTIRLSALADSGNNDTYTYVGGTDTIVMPDSIENDSNFAFQKSGQDLIFAYNNDIANNTLTIKGYYDDSINIGGHVIIKVAGVTQTLSYYIASKGVTEPIEGTSNAESLGDSESWANQMIYGLGGNDTITGGTGNDYINGGAGSDTMTGLAGNDTYVIDSADWGDGQDVITDSSGENDMLRIDTSADNIHLYFDVTQTGVTDGVVQYTTGTDLFINSSDEFTLANAKTSNGVKVVNYFTNDGKIEKIKLGDGTTDAFDSRLIAVTGQAVANWLYAHGKASVTTAIAECTEEEKAELLNLYKPIISGEYNVYGTANGDIIYGTMPSDSEYGRQYVYGYGGNDVIFASDTTRYENHIDGGAGDDVIYMSGSKSTYVTAGTGNDIVYGADYGNGVIYFEAGGDNVAYLGLRPHNSLGMRVECGAGNDTIYLSPDGNGDYMNGSMITFNTNTILDGGHDTVHWRGGLPTNQEEMMCFDGTDIADVYFTRTGEGNDLVARYGNGNDVTFKDYFKTGNEAWGSSMVLFFKDVHNWPNFATHVSANLKHYISGSGGTINGTGEYHVDDYIVGSDLGETIRPLGGDDYVDAKGGNDTIYITSWGNQVINCGLGSDILYLGGVNEADTTLTVYTNSKYGGKDTTVSTWDSVDYGALTSNGNTVYAQSYKNTITGGHGNDNYFAYIDQSTTITDSEGNDILTFMNTNETTDGARENLSILCNVTSDYNYDGTAETIYNGDVLITSDVTKTNYDNWKGGSYFTGVSLNENKVETVKSSDGYTLSREEISVIAESIAGWLSGNGYGSVSDVMSNALGKSAEDSSADITSVLAQFASSPWTLPE